MTHPTILNFADLVAKHHAPKPEPAPLSGQTVVEYRSDPNHSFTQVTIYGPTADAVQVAITRAMRSVEREGGLATFRGPKRVLGGFGAVGEIIDIPAEAAE